MNNHLERVDWPGQRQFARRPLPVTAGKRNVQRLVTNRK